MQLGCPWVAVTLITVTGYVTRPTHTANTGGISHPAYPPAIFTHLHTGPTLRTKRIKEGRMKFHITLMRPNIYLFISKLIKDNIVLLNPFPTISVTGTTGYSPYNA
jgi:hypothetical protein